MLTLENERSPLFCGLLEWSVWNAPRCHFAISEILTSDRSDRTHHGAAGDEHGHQPSDKRCRPLHGDINVPVGARAARHLIQRVVRKLKHFSAHRRVSFYSPPDATIASVLGCSENAPDTSGRAVPLGTG